jgi:hypothetical protein
VYPQNKPRVTKTSLKAGFASPLEEKTLGGPIRRAKSESEKVAERQKKSREVEEQLIKRAGIFDQQKEKTVESKSKMTKSMIAPSARDAPKFSSRRPQELRRFVRGMEDLWREAGIEDDEDKKESIGKYADQESEEEWRALESFPRGYTWEEFKRELIENYPEAAEAERGTPARIKQICRDTRDIRLGDLAALYAFRRQFMTEAKKLNKDPPAMANRELVELFIGSLSSSFTAALLQYLGNKAEQRPTTLSKAEQKQPETSGTRVVARRPEDKYDLEEVCKAAVQVSENSQGIFSLMNVHDSGSDKRSTKMNQYQLQPAGDTNVMVQKLESLENKQAEEKDRIDIVNKNLDSKFTALEDMMKNFMNQVQTNSRKEQVPQYDPNSGIRLGQAGSVPRWMPNGRINNFEGENKCFYCGGRNHYIPECDEFKIDLKAGRIKLNDEGKMRMPDGGYVPNMPNGATIKERMERYNGRKQNQFYCGYDDNGEIPEEMMPRYPSQFINMAEDPAHRRARLELQLKEEELELRKLKLEREEKKREQTGKSSRSVQLLDLINQIEQEENSKSGFN